MTRGLFLDRDGTLIIDTGYPRDPELVKVLPGVAAALRAARELGFALVIVGNQSGVGRGLISPAELEAVQARVAALLATEGVTFDDVRFCVHGPDDGCACRKPRAGMLLDAAKAGGIDLTRSVMVGDRDSDMLAGRAVGCTTVIVGGEASVNADHVIESFEALVPILRALG